MKRSFLIFALILFVNSFAGQSKPWLDPKAVAEGKEPARSLVRSYSGSQEALFAGDESLYMQPLRGDWKVVRESEQTIYERDFKVPFAWVDRNILLHLDAVGSAFEVFVNDKRVGYSQSTGTPSEFDIARYTVEGRNTLRIVVHTNHIGQRVENYAAKSSDRLGEDNFVLSQPKVRVRDFVTDTRIEAGNGLFSLGVVVKSHLLNNKELKVYYELLSPEGKVVANGNRDARFDMRGEDTVRFFANIPKIRAWSHESPNLYTLNVKTQREGRFQEYLSFAVGFRNVEMVEGELLLNGRAVNLVIAPYVGQSSVEIMKKELTELKQSGVNMIKVKGHPLQAAFYKLCDELGLYVCDQAAVDTHRSGESRRKGGNLSNDPQWESCFTDRAVRMYHNSKNHPSVVMFSIADNSANGYNLYQSYLALKALEQSRPVIYPGAKGEWNSDAVNEESAESKSSNKIVFSPGVVKNLKSFEPVSITAVDSRSGLFALVNNYKHKSLDDVIVAYEVRAGKRVVAQGTVIVNVAPQQREEFRISYLKAKPGADLTITLRVEEPIRAQSYKPTPTTEEPSKKQSKKSAPEPVNILGKQEFRTKL